MIKITLKYGDKEKKVLVPEMQKVGDFLKDAGVDLSEDDGVIVGDRLLSGDELDKSFIELGLAESSELNVKIEYDLPWATGKSEEIPQGSVVYPPKAQIIGCACFIFSAFSPDELRDFQRYLPEALVRRDEKGEPVFAISLDEKSAGSMNEYGAVFSTKSTKSGNAVITILIDPECDDPEEAVRQSLGKGIINLVEQEEYLMTQRGKLEEKKETLNGYISRM